MVRVLGIRHHGPGSARAVARALADLEPDAVLVEGPTEGDALALMAADPDLVPPVALLAHVVDEPARAAFWPFAAFSPEWVALRHAAVREVPLRFIDLPAAVVLAGGDRDEGRPAIEDPLGALAAAAGQDDPERWWEDAVEHRAAGDPFDAVLDAMAELREQAGEPARGEARREAHMRRAIRAAVKEGFERVAVVCGAWHAPVLVPAGFPPASHDNALLRGLPRRKVAATWVPWTHDRLAVRSGYGAGVTSPGWYAHLFSAPDAPVVRWMARSARLLREEGLDASPASAVEAARLAEALAALRGRPLAGLPEVLDATTAALAGGSDLPLALVRERLVVGEDLGSVPASVPQVPLARDLATLQRRLRLKPAAGVEVKELDLRKPTDRERSLLLHRLALVGIPWGRLGVAQGARGTFREPWRLQWQPEFAVRLVEAGGHGTTVAAAAGSMARERAAAAGDLGELAALVDAVLLADLPDDVRAVVEVLEVRAATDADVAHLMDAAVPLARAGRYGTVRETDAEAVLAALHGLATRVLAGLPPACTTLDDDAAAAMAARLDAFGGALAQLDDEGLRDGWRRALAALLRRADVHGLVAGRACRALVDDGALDAEEAGRRLAQALSSGGEPASGAAWIEGFFSGGGTVLLHDEALLGLVDRWLTGVPAEAFAELLPLLRRTFSTFEAAERRRLGQRVRRLAEGRPAVRAATDAVDVERARAVLPVLRAVLG